MQELKQAGLKITGPRVIILEFLQQARNSHFSAEAVYNAVRNAGNNIGLATVYRVLAQFEQAGIIKKNSFEGAQSIYELSSSEHHDHIICTKCNKILEFYDDDLENKQLDIAERLGFTLTHHKMNLYGICKKCQKNSKKDDA